MGAFDTTPQFDAVAGIKTRAKQRLQQLIDDVRIDWQAVWANPKATPELVLAEMGTNAGALFDAATARVMFVLGQGGVIPEKYLTAGKPYTRNPDGSITVNA